MKFGKEFTAQMVQEWQQAYMDYNLLKSILKDIMTFKQNNTRTTTTTTNTTQTASTSQAPTTINTLKRKVSLYRAFSGLTTRYRNSPRKRDEEAILVSAVQQGGPSEHYQTMFMMSSDEGGEHELVFFRRLDDEFNKVLHFYRKKVEAVVEEADELTRQMNVLIALRIKVENPANVATIAATIANVPKKQGVRRMDAIQEVEMASEEGAGTTSHMNGNRPTRLDILDHVKINVEPETPISTLKSVLAISSHELTFTKEQLKKSEELMEKAFVEFYHKLRLLKSYSFMNQLAFSKIMKKYDKITLRHASKSYLDMVDKSYLGSCEEVTKLMERVEAAFVKHFSNGNRGKGMHALRPIQKKERHTVTFFLGLFVGCSIALVATILVLIQTRNIIGDQNKEGRTRYMDNIFPLYSLFGFIVLHMIMLAGNVYYWRKHRVNYPFIFNLKEGTDLSYRQVFLLSAALSVLSLAAVTTNLDLRIDPETNKFATLPELVPLILVGVLLIIMFCPFKIIYRTTRFFLITSIFHCFLAPFYKVTLPDSFMADQLTSQVQAFRSMQFYVCYYIWGNFRTRDSDTCQQSEVFKVLLIVVAIIPYWLRFLQCFRRWIEEKRARNAFNGLKYLSIVIALSARTLHEQRTLHLQRTPLEQRTPHELRNIQFLMIVAAATSGVATIYATYWDLVVDWGLLQRKSKNRWLRDKLIIPNKSVYFVAIVANCLLRLAWMQTVMGFREAPFIHQKAMISIVACLEIIRRGIWNFFRLENEHLNNVGKYRAFNSVPLPFNYEDGEKHS